MSLRSLGRIGPALQKKLQSLGIETCEDLIFYFPRRFDDFSFECSIGNLRPGMTATIQGRIDLIKNRRSKNRRMAVTEALVSDDTGSIQVVWFNQPFLIKNLHVGDAVRLSGATNDHFYSLQFVSPTYEKVRDGLYVVHTKGLVPVYSLPGGMFQKQFRLLVHAALKQSLPSLQEWLPKDIMARESFPPLQTAVRDMHTPDTESAHARAMRRFAFEEIFLLQLASLSSKSALSRVPAHPISFDAMFAKKVLASLPFSLTSEQKTVAWDIIANMQNNHPMSRLLEGDVGSGKTVVSSLAMAQVVHAGHQCAVMAPTELLARQHFATMSTFFDRRPMSIALVTASCYQLWNSKEGTIKYTGKRDKQILLSEIKNGTIGIVVGTHALLEESVRFHSLALAVIDEQHRFGVRQRALLQEKNDDHTMPHMLSMSATPIPRSLALTIYGDLDLSLIKKLPGGRKKIETKIVPNKYREWTYDFIKKEVARGRQAFIVCPVIDISDTLGCASVKEEYHRLVKGPLVGLRLGMLHGKLKSKEKDTVMQAMLDKTIDVLVTTTVVEVGIDIPNASVMLIEGAERFGLAQLHQLRGRVGRSIHQSYCFLLPTDEGKETNARLKAVVQSQDGFALAEKDLELRGEGDILGFRQAGLPMLKIARLSDGEMIQKARDWAARYADHLSNYPELQRRVEHMRQGTHLE